MSLFPSLGPQHLLPRAAPPTPQPHQPLPSAHLAATIWWMVSLVGIMGSLALIQQLAGWDITLLGIRPHTTWGWLGIFTAPFFHVGLDHFASNAGAMLVGGFALLNVYPTVALRVMAFTALGSGLLVYLLADCCSHIGASGVIYGINMYLLMGGLIRRGRTSLAVALLAVFLSPGLLWGMSPLAPREVSWQGHLFGALMGLLLAVIYRRQDPPPPHERYAWEDAEEEKDKDDEDELKEDAEAEVTSQPASQPTQQWRISHTLHHTAQPPATPEAEVKSDTDADPDADRR